MYGMERATLTEKTAQKLRSTKRAMKRRILDIRLRNNIRNATIKQTKKANNVVKKNYFIEAKVGETSLL